MHDVAEFMIGSIVKLIPSYPDIFLPPRSKREALHTMDLPFTLAELNTGLACDPTDAYDASGNRLANLACLDREGRELLLGLCNDICHARTRTLTQEDIQGRLSLIFKNRGAPTKVENWRPVTIQPSFSALISRLWKHWKRLWSPR